MQTTNRLLADTLTVLLDSWRYDLNKVYAERDHCADDPTAYQAKQREINRRIDSIKAIESILDLCINQET